MCVKVCHDAFLWACNYVYGVCVFCMNKHNKKSDRKEREERLKGRGRERESDAEINFTGNLFYIWNKKKPQKLFYWLRNNSLICYVRDSFQAPKMDDQKKNEQKNKQKQN